MRKVRHYLNEDFIYRSQAKQIFLTSLAGFSKNQLFLAGTFKQISIRSGCIQKYSQCKHSFFFLLQTIFFRAKRRPEKTKHACSAQENMLPKSCRYLQINFQEINCDKNCHIYPSSFRRHQDQTSAFSCLKTTDVKQKNG